MIDFVHGDVLEWAKTYRGEPAHALLADPPYELSFMNRHWDSTGIAFRAETWAALGEHLLPGAFGMAFSGARTYHRMACAIEDAGFVLHSMIGWVYGSGFPKATRIDTQVDRAAGAEREVVGRHIQSVQDRKPGNSLQGSVDATLAWQFDLTAPATPLAATWAGHRYGLQSLKPALEPICIFQKPYAGRPVDSITRTGAGALWIEGGRVGTDPITQSLNGHNLGNHGIYGKSYGPIEEHTTAGRWPSNLILQHAPGCKRVGVKRVKPLEGYRPNPVNVQSDGQIVFNEKPAGYQKTSYTDDDGTETVEAWECVEGCAAAALGRMSGVLARDAWAATQRNHSSEFWGEPGGTPKAGYGDVGTCARFFQQCDWALEEAEPFYYCAKASRRERDAGLEGMPLQEVSDQSAWAGVCNVCGCRMMLYGKPTCGHDDFRWEVGKPRHNPHPTVKPLSLARYLATLLLPPAEYAPRRILVPFSGVCSEAIGGLLAGFDQITAIEAEQEYVEMGRERVRFWSAKMRETGLTDPGAILKTCGRKGKGKPDSSERWPDGSLFENLEAELCDERA